MTPDTNDSHDRARLAMLALSGLAIVALSFGMLSAGFIDLIGQGARFIAEWLGASEDLAKGIEVGTEVIAEIVTLFL